MGREIVSFRRDISDLISRFSDIIQGLILSNTLLKYYYHVCQTAVAGVATATSSLSSSTLVNNLPTNMDLSDVSVQGLFTSVDRVKTGYLRSLSTALGTAEARQQISPAWKAMHNSLASLHRSISDGCEEFDGHRTALRILKDYEQYPKTSRPMKVFGTPPLVQIDGQTLTSTVESSHVRSDDSHSESSAPLTAARRNVIDSTTVTIAYPNNGPTDRQGHSPSGPRPVSVRHTMRGVHGMKAATMPSEPASDETTTTAGNSEILQSMFQPIDAALAEEILFCVLGILFHASIVGIQWFGRRSFGALRRSLLALSTFKM